MFRRPLTLLSALALIQACTPVSEEPPAAPPEPAAAVEQKLAVPGFAELHHHMFAEEAFGGGWFHGGHTGTLVSCDGGEPESDHYEHHRLADRSWCSGQLAPPSSDRLE